MNQNLRQMCRKVIAVGRNYLEHARELGSQMEAEPVIFLKPSSSIIEQGHKIEIPEDVSELHHEVEFGIVIGKVIRKAKPTDFTDCILGFLAALDMTDRGLQNQLKSRQLPWTLSKSLDTSCPVGPILPCSLLPRGVFAPRVAGSPLCQGRDVELWLDVNGKERQRSSINKMIHSPCDLISFISYKMSLEPGDLILTGTPAGVGPVESGDLITFGLEGFCRVEFQVA